MNTKKIPTYTPGPWLVEGLIKPVGDPNKDGVHNLYSAVIAPVVQNEYRGIICSIQSADHIGGISREEAEANALLIAAAPDLLKALRALQLVCLADPLNPCWRPGDVVGLHWGSSENEKFPACSSCNARAAIAKATEVI